MDMRSCLRVSLGVIAVAALASGCVSMGAYQKLESAKNDEIETLKQHKAALENQKKALDQQKTAVEQQNTALKQKVATLEQQNAAMQRQVSSLEHHAAALVASSQERQKQYEELLKGLSKEVEKGQLQVRQYQNMLAVDLAEQIFFDSGRATLKPSGKEVLKKVGKALKEYENKLIRVVGHTDNVKVARSLQATFPTNWELSVARATNVVRYLQEVGVPPERMIPAGRGEYEPVASNATPGGRQKNRRIEIMLIDQSLASEMTKSAD
jgi:chemotaxis protein MotB